MSNTTLNVLIVEDSISYGTELEMICLDLGLTVLAIVTDSASALDVIFAEGPDIILMDINIGGKLDGLEIGEKIKHLDIPILFITSYGNSTNIAKAHKTNLAGYLVKPISKEKVHDTIQEIMKTQLSLNEEGDMAVVNKPNDLKALFFIKNGQYHKVKLEDVLYVASEDNYCKFHFSDASNFLIRITMNEVEQAAFDKSFFRSHRKYLINTGSITAIDLKAQLIHLGTNIRVPFSRSKKDEVKELGQFLN